MALTEEQKQAVETPKHLAVIASAGTGKTTVLTERFLHCLNHRNAKLHEILAFTFTDKATREMKNRVIQKGQFDPASTPQLQITSIHAFCHKILRLHGLTLQLHPDFEIYDDTSFKLFVSDYSKAWISNELRSGNATLKKMLQYYGSWHIHKTVYRLIANDLWNIPAENQKCFSIDDSVEADILDTFISDVRQQALLLQQERIRSQTITYDDLEILTLELLTKQPALLKKYQSKFKFILVDEYQDISPRQFKLIKKLFRPEMNEIFIVGDPKQSIYGFRSADLRLFFEMANIISKHGGKTIYLTQTFRTPKNLQSYFNTIFPTILTENLFVSGTTSKDLPSASVFALKVTEDTASKSLFHTSSARHIAGLIRNLIDRQKVPPSKIAILCPTRNKMPIYETELVALNIPTNTLRSNALFESSEILAVWHILNHLAAPPNRITQAGILRHVPFGFSEGFMSHLLRSEVLDIFSGQTPDLFASTKEKDNWHRLCHLMSKWRSLTNTLYAAEIYQTIVADVFCDSNQIRFDPLLRILKSWQTSEYFTLSSVKTWLLQLPEMDLSIPAEQDSEGVQILTVHAAKGLEFEHVFIVPDGGTNSSKDIFAMHPDKGIAFKAHDLNAEKSIKHSLSDSDSIKEIKTDEKLLSAEEIRRLLYVAFTRAEHSLYLFPEPLSKEKSKKLMKNPTDLSCLTSFNDWMYWAAELAAPLLVQSMPEALPESTLNASDTEITTNTIAEAQSSFLPCDFKNLTPVLSVSELETFRECPRQFELRYIRNIRPVRRSFAFKAVAANQPTKIRLTALERGNLFHEILQFYEVSRDANLDTVINQALFNQHIVDTDGSILAECHLFVQNLKRDPFIRSVLFDNIESKEELSFTLQLDKICVIGQMDKIVKVDKAILESEWLVIDYKTQHTHSETQRDELAAQYQFQMQSYALSAAKHLGVDRIDSMILFTNGPHYRLMTHDRSSLDKFESQLNSLTESYHDNSRHGQFPLTKKTTNCSHCPYFKDDYCGIQTQKNNSLF